MSYRATKRGCVQDRTCKPIHSPGRVGYHHAHIEIMSTLARHDRRFDSHDRRFEAVDKRFEAIDKRFEAIDKRFDDVDRRFDAVDRRFDAVDKRFDGIEAAIKALVGTVNELALEVRRLAKWEHRIWGMVKLASWGAVAIGALWAALGDHVRWVA